MNCVTSLYHGFPKEICIEIKAVFWGMALLLKSYQNIQYIKESNTKLQVNGYDTKFNDYKPNTIFS